MKKNLFYSLFTALCLVAVCGVFAACGGDDDDPVTPGGGGSETKVSQATFTYGVVINKDIPNVSDLTVTLTPSTGTPVTKTLTAANGKLATNMSVMEKLIFESLIGEGDSRADYYIYTIPVTVKDFPTTIKVSYQWNTKSDVKLDETAKYTVSLGSGYYALTNTNQSVNSSGSLQTTRTSGKMLPQLLPTMAKNNYNTYTLSVSDNELSVYKN